MKQILRNKKAAAGETYESHCPPTMLFLTSFPRPKTARFVSVCCSRRSLLTQRKAKQSSEFSLPPPADLRHTESGDWWISCFAGESNATGNGKSQRHVLGVCCWRGNLHHHHHHHHHHCCHPPTYPPPRTPSPPLLQSPSPGTVSNSVAI